MKLYELPRNSYFTIKDQPEETFLFKHVDGMYSICYDKHKSMHHIAAWTEVERVDAPSD